MSVGGAERPRCGRDAGFTLLEIIVCIGLLALILSAMPAALRLGSRALNVIDKVDRDFANRMSIDFLAQRLTQTIAIYDRGADGRLKVMFQGKANAILFVAPAVLGSSGGLYLFEVKPDSRPLDKPMMMLKWTEYRARKTDGKARPVARERELVHDLYDYSFRYYGSASARAQPEWLDDWTSTDTLPEMVDIRVTALNAGQTITRSVRVPLRLRPSL
jgi:prepilin-type N-terminal cleavage/methylation domain-containing protein